MKLHICVIRTVTGSGMDVLFHETRHAEGGGGCCLLGILKRHVPPYCWCWSTLPIICWKGLAAITQHKSACWEPYQQRTKYEIIIITTTPWFWRAVAVICFVSVFSLVLQNYFSISLFVYSTFTVTLNAPLPLVPPPPPFPVGAAKGNSLLRKIKGALWRLDVLISRYGAPS